MSHIVFLEWIAVQRSNSWINNPLLSFGSNHVDFGGISLPASATVSSSSMEVGYMANATASFS